MHTPMGDLCTSTSRDSLVDDLESITYGRIQRFQVDDDTTEASQCNVTRTERQNVRNLDHQLCFVTRIYTHRAKIAHILNNNNAGNRKLVDALRGLGIVHHKFDFADISTLILLSQELHYLWDKHATFVIVPSEVTRLQMIVILRQELERITLAYPEIITYDIVFVQPSALGGAGSYFQHAANPEDAHPICLEIPAPSTDLVNRLEYLAKSDGTRVREFLNLQHVTSRASHQAVNPYLMVMNAHHKLRSWIQRGIGNPILTGFVPDPVFTAALKDCEAIMLLMSSKRGGIIRMSRLRREGETQGSKEDDMAGDRDEDLGSASSANRALPEELQSPTGAAHVNYGSSMNPGKQSWISRGGPYKAGSMENWRQEVSEFADVVSVIPDD